MFAAVTDEIIFRKYKTFHVNTEKLGNKRKVFIVIPHRDVVVSALGDVIRERNWRGRINKGEEHLHLLIVEWQYEQGDTEWLGKIYADYKWNLDKPGVFTPQQGDNMLVQPDFSEIQEDVAPGTYKGVIKKGEVKEWPSGGQYVNWEIETYGEANAKNNGRRIFYKTSVSGKGAFMLQKFYRAATGSTLTGQFDTEQLVGKRVEIELVEGVNRSTGAPTGYNDVKSVRAVATN